MSLSVRVAAALGAVVLVALAGCIPGAPINVKTTTVAHAIESLPGVTTVTVDSQERTQYTAARSDVYAGLSAAATADEVGSILTAFAAANRDTGPADVSSRLRLIVDNSANQIDLEFAALTEAQAAAAAEAWLDLRDSYDSAALHIFGPDELAVGVTVMLGGEPSVERDLGALYSARDVATSVGPVTDFTAVDGKFGASGALPNDAWLALAQKIAGLVEVSGQYYGDDNSFGFKADYVATDAATQRRVAALVPAGDAVEIEFRTDDGTAVFFATASCERYLGLDAADPSRALLEAWADDGRTLVDGSTVASCFS